MIVSRMAGITQGPSCCGAAAARRFSPLDYLTMSLQKAVSVQLATFKWLRDLFYKTLYS